MKTFLPVRWLRAVCLLLGACSAEPGGVFEAASNSIGQSKKDSLFLTTCTITPDSALLADAADLLIVKEAFIERRFGVSKLSDKVTLLDSLTPDAQLVIITQDGSRLGGAATEATLEAREAPFEGAAQRGRDVFALPLTASQLGRPFALRLEVKTGPAAYQSYNLVVRPRPVPQTWDESYSAALSQARQNGMLLAPCSVPSSAVASDAGLRLRLQEAFIERRYQAGARTQELRPLGGERVRLVLVGAADTQLGPVGAKWQISLPGGTLTGYQEAARVLAFNVPARYQHEPFGLTVRLQQANGQYQTQVLRVEPLPEPVVPTAAPPVATAGVEEHFALYNASSAASQQAGMLRTAYAVAPAVIEGPEWRLEVEQAFIEQHALRNSLSRRVELDSTNEVGPRLVVVCRPGTRLAGLGVTWDLRLADDPRALPYQVEEQPNLLLFHVPPRYIGRAFDLVVTTRNAAGPPHQQRLRLRPVAAPSV